MDDLVDPELEEDLASLKKLNSVSFSSNTNTDSDSVRTTHSTIHN